MSAVKAAFERKKFNTLAMREAIAGYFFISPILLSFLVFFWGQR